jgi:hypothetical protein
MHVETVGGLATDSTPGCLAAMGFGGFFFSH